jgi:hypothetical protein
MSGSNDQQPQGQTAAPPDLNAAIQALIRQQIAAASGQGQQVQLPSATPPPSQYSNDPSQGPDLLARIGLALGGGSLPGAPAALRQQMGKQALLNFGIGLLGAGRFDTPGQVLAGGLRGAQSGLLGSEAAQAGQQEYALNAQTKLAELGMQQQKNRTEALTALVPLLQMQGRLGLPPLFGGAGGGPGGAGGPSGGPGGGDTELTGDASHDLPLIAQRESGGNPNALNYVAMQDPSAYARGATASGKYQMVNSTWREALQLAGGDPSQYPTAMSAPEAVQDKAAQALYGKYGTAPWDASKFTSNWVAQPGGGYQLVKGAQPPASGPGSAQGAPVGPFKGPPAAGPFIGTTATQPAATPPSGLPEPPIPPAGAPSTIATPEDAGVVAKATGNKIAVPGTQGLWARPEGGVTSTPPALGPIQTTAASPAAAPAPVPTPPADQAQPTPPPPSAAPAPAPAPAPTPKPASRAQDYSVQDTALTPEEYQERHFVPLTADQVKAYAPGPTSDEAAAAADQVQRARANVTAQQTQLDQMRRGLLPGDAAKQAAQVTDAQKELDAAENTYNDQVQKLAQSGAKNLLDRDNAERQRVSADYKAQVIDVAAAKAKAEADLQQARVTSGLSFHNQMAENDAKMAQEQTLNPMATQAMKSHNVDLGLQQLQAVLPSLPKGGGAVGMLLNAHPDWAPALAAFGSITDKQATAVQLIQGITSAMSAEMKPTGLGAMREYEFEAFKSQLPHMLENTDGQTKALAFLRNFNQRIQQENSWMQGYYYRKVPDETSQNPNAQRPARNLDPEGPQSIQQKMDAALGPVIPSYVPSDAARKAGGEPAWEASLRPGQPYYRPHSDGSTSMEVRGFAGG